MYKHRKGTVSHRSMVRAGSTASGERGGLHSGITLLAAIAGGFFIGALLFAPGVGRDEKRNASYLPLTPYTKTASSEEPSTETAEPSPASGNEVRLSSPVITVSIEGTPTEMELEDYLIGVVAAEMPASSEHAALCAQAVAARTFTALHMADKAKCRSGCSVCDDPQCCQAFLSYSKLRERWGNDFDKNLENIRSAVGDTRGMVAVYNGELISALYHASSGPATESSEEVFAMALPYLVSVESCEGEHEMVTKQEFSADDVVSRINAAYPEANMTLPLAPLDLDIWGRTKSGRVQLIRIGETVIPGSDLRRVLGLKSTAFDVVKDGDTVTFTCLGYGHGVGMSQLGANEMAKKGSDYAEILKHFYTGTELARLKFDD